MFNLDTPTNKKISYITNFSGWFIPEENQKVRLNVSLNGKTYVTLSHGILRPDVAAAFPQQENALNSGFSGDILIPHTIKPGEIIEIEISEQNQNISLLKKEFTLVANESQQLQPRKRKFELKQLLYCPECGSKLNQIDRSCGVCNYPVYTRGNTPHILQKGDLPFLRLTETEKTHPYSPYVIELLTKIGDGLVLDFGAGNTPEGDLRPNICYLDVQQYPHTDIVCNTTKLPFPDAIFDAVISQAVFEHIPNPFLTAKELHRILKPGGIIFIDTAFMQPLHGDPSHYFNMTLHGLRLVMSDFEELRSGIRPYQYPSFGFIMQLEAVLPYITQQAWKNKLQDWREFLLKEGKNLDMALGKKGREIVAAGVFFEGIKAVK
ncbi:class I SAM-dependent methyltransferase [Microseira wollei]|uniref:Methyltransferase type 11 n=1 Tax=Microseira wollei NIES-4236 TaxID=2530354 RepID=A0AAV3X737_9CYAN|nr:class I SAM-dependent methyltransferase [Microseira wollei]GET37168.1 methyltransferase type 11 [Microseira wollei NIES-4236]